MSERLRVFVNERPIGVPAGSTVMDAVRAFDPALERRVANQEAYVTDARGIRIEGDVLLSRGAILRVVVTSRRAAEDSDGDA